MENEDILARIQLLKKQLADSQGLQIEESRLSQLREKLESEMNTPEIKSKKILVNACQRKMLKIDHILDELEEWTDERVLLLKEELVFLILQLHPKQQATYNDLSFRLNDAQNMKTHIKTIKNHLNKIVDAIETMATKRNEVKRRGVFSYILGPNPNVIIGQCLMEICDAAEACASCNPKNEELRNELVEVITRCKGRWGFGTIDKIFIPMKERFSEYLNEQQGNEKQLNNEIQDLEGQIQGWINQFSK